MGVSGWHMRVIYIYAFKNAYTHSKYEIPNTIGVRGTDGLLSPNFTKVQECLAQVVLLYGGLQGGEVSILKIRDGELGDANDGEVSIDIPKDILIEESSDPITSIVDFTYPNLFENINDPSYFQEKAILALTNEVEDSHEHLFFECHFSSQVWSSVKVKAGLHQVSDLWDSIVNEKLSLEQLVDTIMATVRLKLLSVRFKKLSRVERVMDEWDLPTSLMHNHVAR
ncbi:hypothetical protein CTI12_AA226990 [Artemisia annua]|uniref:Uncharacterized protein n=1 Tax=Artemisia annua TaxID=35608 RepID=A0A2U1NU25_ARTAN|nr:hypothetical protein CTI12_AA226990 [Artemisia annua]